MGKKISNRSISKKAVDSKSTKVSEKKLAQQAIEKKRLQQILIGGAVALVVIAAVTFGLIMFYGDSVVARVNGIAIRGTEVEFHTATARTALSDLQPFMDGIEWERAVREEAARIAAEGKIFEDFARRNGISFDSGQSQAQITNTVITAIVADPALFAQFEQHMQEDPAIEAGERAQAILERIHAGEDFDTLMHTYSEDFGGLSSNPDGYTFIENQMVPEFEEGTRALEIGELSGLIRTTHGYHIILRIEPDPDNVFMGAEADLEDLLGAKHILISATSVAENDRMRQAVSAGFQEKVNNADLTFRGALDRIG